MRKLTGTEKSKPPSNAGDTANPTSDSLHFFAACIEMPLRVELCRMGETKMSVAPQTLTYEQLQDLIAGIAIAQKETDKKLAKLGDRIGELVESMVEGGIVRLFQTLGYEFTRCSRRVEFKNKERNVSGEIDLFLENGEYALLVEVKTNLSDDDVRDHVERLKKFRVDADSRGDKRQFLAAAGGGIIRENVQKFALKQGMYVIQQSGENVEVIPPDGEPKVW
jgi:hypothetical protein